LLPQKTCNNLHLFIHNNTENIFILYHYRNLLKNRKEDLLYRKRTAVQEMERQKAVLLKIEEELATVSKLLNSF